MKKNILKGVGIVFVAFVAYAVYGAFFAPKKSPPTTAAFSDRGLDINVSYSQPSKRGRVIFGEEAAGALQPFGQYWRLGANAATEITFSKDINFAGQPVNAGSYRMYAVPGAEAFKITLNSELGVNFTAAMDADHALDVVSVDIPVQAPPSEVETFVINFSSDSVGVNTDFVWDKTLIRVPVSVRQ